MLLYRENMNCIQRSLADNKGGCDVDQFSKLALNVAKIIIMIVIIVIITNNNNRTPRHKSTGCTNYSRMTPSFLGIIKRLSIYKAREEKKG